MKLKMLAIAALISTTLTANAAVVCTSKPNANGGTASITIDINQNGEPTIKLFAQGGRAQFVTSEGPFVATAQHEPDGTFYTFEDSFGQTGTVAVITSAFGGKLTTTASSDFGMWGHATMFCK